MTGLYLSPYLSASHVKWGRAVGSPLHAMAASRHASYESMLVKQCHHSISPMKNGQSGDGAIALLTSVQVVMMIVDFH